MLDLHIKMNDSNLDLAEKRLFGISLGEAIANFYEDKANLKAFRKEKRNLKKEVERLEAKRDSGREEQKG